MTNNGTIHRLKQRGGKAAGAGDESEEEHIKTEKKSNDGEPDKKVDESIQKCMEKINKEEEKKKQETIRGTFNRWMETMFKNKDYNNENADMKTHIRYYKTDKPNGRGTYISDFDIVVNNEVAPFTGLDQVDYFLKNYVGMIENEKLAKTNPRRKERSYYFNKIEKEIPHFFSKEVREDANTEYVEKNEDKIETKKGGKRTRYKKGKKRGNKTRRKNNK
tara:strand:+ start:36 stop:692 length:657 start_codon:yes stop_codon:yes gene_type:complete